MKFLVTGGTGFIGLCVVRNLRARGIPVVATDLNGDTPLDVADAGSVENVFRQHPDITHCIHLAYMMSAEVEADPARGVEVNIGGMVNMFEAAARHKLQRLIFASSETVYGASQKPYGNRPVTEDDFCAPRDHFFTYGVMKILNEFMAQKYIQKHGISIISTRPPVVYGHGRKRGSVLWAEAFASDPAIGKTVCLPFPSTNRDTWIYKDDCAEQFVRLALKPQLGHFAYNNGGHCVTGKELADAVRHWIPDAQITFDETKPSTPLIDWQGGERIEKETGFTPRSLLDGVKAHIDEAKKI